jgi:hypothetical protein
MALMRPTHPQPVGEFLAPAPRVWNSRGQPALTSAMVGQLDVEGGTWSCLRARLSFPFLGWLPIRRFRPSKASRFSF